MPLESINECVFTKSMLVVWVFTVTSSYSFFVVDDYDRFILTIIIILLLYFIIISFPDDWFIRVGSGIVFHYYCCCFGMIHLYLFIHNVKNWTRDTIATFFYLFIEELSSKSKQIYIYIYVYLMTYKKSQCYLCLHVYVCRYVYLLRHSLDVRICLVCSFFYCSAFEFFRVVVPCSHAISKYAVRYCISNFF